MSDLMKEWRSAVDQARTIEDWRRADELAHQVGSLGFNSLDEVGDALSLTMAHLGIGNNENPSKGNVGETWLEGVVSSAAVQLKRLSCQENDFWDLGFPAHSLGEDERICAVSGPWCDLLGYTSSDVIGRYSVDFLTEGSRLHATERALPEFWRRRVIHDVNYDFVHRSGEIVPVVLSAFVIQCRDASPGAVRSFATITPAAMVNGTANQAEDVVEAVQKHAS